MIKKVDSHKPSNSQPPMDSFAARMLFESKKRVSDAVSERHLMGPYATPKKSSSLKDHEVRHIDPKNKLAKHISSAWKKQNH